MKRRSARWLAALGLLVAAALVVGTALAARPGGGQSFGGPSGGTSSPSSGGSRGGGGGIGDCFAMIELLLWFIQLHFESPILALCLDAVLIAIGTYFYFQSKKNARLQDWSTTHTKIEPAPPPPRGQRPHENRDALARSLKAVDPEFSLPLFEDFFYALYATSHEDRGKGDLSPLSAYFDKVSLDGLRTLQSGLTSVEAIVIGAMRYRTVMVEADGAARVTLEVESNYTENGPSGAHSFYAREVWTLVRNAGVLSRPPARARTLDCPSCGAPITALRGGVCSYCKKDVGQGAFDWRVVEARTFERQPRGPMLTGDTEEQGTNSPTVVHPSAHDRLHKITEKDPTFAWESFVRRVGLVFSTFQTAWSSRDLMPVRGFLSDQLFQMQLYWIETYKRQRLRNITENARITRVELASVISDKHYDSVTIRLFATSLDYTLSDDDQRLVSGSRSRPRAYSEYWTFIRGSSAHTKPEQGPPACPYCGAPLAVTMAGDCTYCKAKVIAGEFDWVLSRIEQDDVYG